MLSPCSVKWPQDLGGCQPLVALGISLGGTISWWHHGSVNTGMLSKSSARKIEFLFFSFWPRLNPLHFQVFWESNWGGMCTAFCVLEHFLIHCYVNPNESRTQTEKVSRAKWLGSASPLPWASEISQYIKPFHMSNSCTSKYVKNFNVTLSPDRTPRAFSLFLTAPTLLEAWEGGFMGDALLVKEPWGTAWRKQAIPFVTGKATWPLEHKEIITLWSYYIFILKILIIEHEGGPHFFSKGKKRITLGWTWQGHIEQSP